VGHASGQSSREASNATDGGLYRDGIGHVSAASGRPGRFDSCP
jgi:hypothetical protein